MLIYPQPAVLPQRPPPILMPSSAHSGTSQIPQIEAVQFLEPETARQNLGRLSRSVSPSLAGALPALLADSPDPDSALLLFERLTSESSSETLRLIERHPFLAHYAIAV